MKGILLYQMVLEALSGEVISEQRLVWHNGANDEVAGKLFLTQENQGHQGRGWVQAGC